MPFPMGKLIQKSEVAKLPPRIFIYAKEYVPKCGKTMSPMAVNSERQL